MREEIFYNVLKDWSKKDISPEDKAEFIREYLRSEKISSRELSRRLNIPHSTLHDWISMRQYKKFKKIKEEKEDFNNNIFKLSDRLLFLLSNTNDIDSKTRSKLILLKSEIEKVEVISI